MDLYDFDEYALLQRQGLTTQKETGFKGVQELDLATFDESLKGFTGGGIRLRPRPGAEWVKNQEKAAFVSQEFNLNFITGNSAARSVVIGTDSKLEEKIAKEKLGGGGGGGGGAGEGEGESGGEVEGGVEKENDGWRRKYNI